MIEPELMLMPLVIEELRILYPACITEKRVINPLTRAEEVVLVPHREELPASGPMIICDRTGRPWTSHYFRQRWREIARAVGVPDDVWNMDSRSGGISEATDAGAQLEDVRHAATHSNIATTQRYSRGSADKAAKVQRLRVVHRKGTP